MAIDIVKTNTATRSDYLRAAAAYKSSEDSLSYWEQLLQPAQQQYQSAQQVASAQAGYDITSAYKNYLSQQQAIGSSNLLGVTQKELGSQAKSQYSSAYSQAQSNLYSNLAQAQSEYQTNYQTAYKQLEETSKSLEEADVAILNYIQDYGVKLGYTEEELQNMYAVNPTTGQRELTDFGKNIYATAFDFGGREDSNPDNVIPSLRQYLAERGDTDVIDYIYQNRDLVTQTLAGFSGTQDYDTTRKSLQYEKIKKTLENRNVVAEKAKQIGGSLDYQTKIGDVIEDYKFVKTVKGYWDSGSDWKLVKAVTTYANNIRAESDDIIEYNNRLFVIKRDDAGKISYIAEVKKKENNNA